MGVSSEVGEAVAPAAASEVEGGWKEDPQEAGTGDKEADEDQKREPGEWREEDEKEVH